MIEERSNKENMTKQKRKKDKIDQSKKSGVVYRIRCKNCDDCNILERGRQLNTKVKEHKTEFDTLPEASQTRSQESSLLRVDINLLYVTTHHNRITLLTGIIWTKWIERATAGTDRSAKVYPSSNSKAPR